MLKKTVPVFNADLVEDTPTKGYPKISEAAVRTCATKQFLKRYQNSQECTCTGVFFQPATFSFIEKQTPAYIAFYEFCDIL